MDFWFAAFVVVSTIAIILCVGLMLVCRVVAEQARDADVAMILCIGLMLVCRSTQADVHATRAELAAFQKTPVNQVTLEEPDTPERLVDLLRMVEKDVHVPLSAIPPSFRKSGQPIEMQKLAVLLQDPEAKPEEFDPLWVQAIANLAKTDPNAGIAELTGEFNRLVALEEAESQTPVPPSPEDEAAAPRAPGSDTLASPVKPSFQALFQDHFPLVFARVQRFGLPAQEAEGVTVEVFVAVFKALDPWLRAITYRTAREHLERGGAR
jgi:hypothetical protein